MDLLEIFAFWGLVMVASAVAIPGLGIFARVLLGLLGYLFIVCGLRTIVKR
mgnify:CR=1 FL=1